MTSAAALKDLTALHAKVTAEWKKKNHSECASLLDRARVMLTSQAAAPFLPTSGDAAALAAQKKELLLARDVLEIGAHLAIARKDDAMFERCVAQLKTHYVDYKDVLPESAYQYELLGLNLMCLLSKNKIADFHTELEQLPTEALHNNPYVRCPVRMEQFIMEGSYNKVVMMRANVPSESYHFFVDRLLDTIRDEIASCMEKAYRDGIAARDAAKMLQLEGKAADAYMKERGWRVNAKGSVVFDQEQEPGTRAFHDEVPTEELARMAITYAKEMEQIV